MMDDLSFKMGIHEARFPTDRRYTENHLWMLPSAAEPGVFRVGLTAYSIRLLRDVYFLDWSAGVDFPVAKKAVIGQIESSKAVSGMFAPADGRILRFNDDVLGDPSLINADGYHQGWLFDFQTAAPGMSAADYVELLEHAWKEAQRTIKKLMG